MTAFNGTNVFDKHLQARRLDQMPLQEIRELKEHPHFQHLMQQLELHTTLMAEVGLDPEIRNAAAQAIVSACKILVQEGMTHNAYFLTAPTLDPFNLRLPDPRTGLDLVAVAKWEHDNDEKYGPTVLNTALEIMHLTETCLEQKKCEGRTYVFDGAMRNGKTELALSIISMLNNLGWRGQMHAFIEKSVADIDEETGTATIATRKGGRQGGTSLKITYVVENAVPINLEEFLAWANNPEPAYKPGHLVFIDEGNFLAWSQQETEDFTAALLKLNREGVSVLISGLDRDARLNVLPTTYALHAAAQNIAKYFSHIPCSGYCLALDANGNITELRANSTARYLLSHPQHSLANSNRIVDPVGRTVISREDVVGMSHQLPSGLHIPIGAYWPIPEELNLWSLLAHDTDARDLLLAYVRQLDIPADKPGHRPDLIVQYNANFDLRQSESYEN
jgi:thymidine kinase